MGQPCGRERSEPGTELPKGLDSVAVMERSTGSTPAKNKIINVRQVSRQVSDMPWGRPLATLSGRRRAYG